MPFESVKMTLRVTKAGLMSIDPPVNVKRSEPALFRLLAGSIPTPASPGPALPGNPTQPFRCPDSTRDAVTGGQTSPLSFDNVQAMSPQWKETFTKKRSLLLQMEIPGQQGENLTVKL